MLVLLLQALGRLLFYFLVLLISLWAWFQWKKWDFLQVARKLPVLMRALPILGHAHYVLFKSWEDASKFLVEGITTTAFARGIQNYIFWCGPLPLVVVCNLEDVHNIINSSSTISKGSDYDFLKHAGGNGLLTAPAHIWKVTRRHITPLFHFQNVEQLMTVFNNNSRELVAELAEHVDGRPVNMLEPTMSIALKTVCQLIFGEELYFDRHTKAFKGMLHIVEKIPALFLKRIVNPFLRLEFVFQLIYRQELKDINSMWKDFTESPLKIATCKYNSALPQCQSKSRNCLVKEGTLNLIDVYKELQRKYPQFTENDLKFEMVTLYCTGTDTIGLAVSTCLLVLGHPDYQTVQDRLYEEIMSEVGEDDDVTPSHISRLQYLDQVYKETLRWSLIVPYTVRETTEEIKLSDCTISAGNSIVVGFVGIHMNPNTYPNPERFDPDRFSLEKSSTRTKNAFMPFSAGARMCIAKTYSDHLVKTMLVHLLRRFSVSTDMDIYNLRKKLIVTYVNADGYQIKVRSRK